MEAVEVQRAEPAECKGDPRKPPRRGGRRRKLRSPRGRPGSGDEAHPPEDGRELHAAPELREVLETHAVHLLEAAEQRLVVGLQARRDPHAFNSSSTRGTGPCTRRSPHAHSGTGHPGHTEGPVAPPQLRHVTYAHSVTYYPGPQAPPSSGPFLAPATLLARA